MHVLQARQSLKFIFVFYHSIFFHFGAYMAGSCVFINIIRNIDFFLLNTAFLNTGPFKLLLVGMKCTLHCTCNTLSSLHEGFHV